MARAKVIIGRDRSSVDWAASREAGGFVMRQSREPETSIESQVYIDGGRRALAQYRRDVARTLRTAKRRKTR